MTTESIEKQIAYEFMDAEIWIVPHQEPRDRIVGLFWEVADAQKKLDSVPNRHLSIMYPCPISCLGGQAGYNSRLVIH